MSTSSVNSSSDDHTTSARRLRELFKGRFDQNTALSLLHDFGGELQAVDFILNEKEEVVQKYLKKSPAYLREIDEDSKKIEEILEHGIEFTVRQFACGPCSRSWWKKVPYRKEVSKCFRCKSKYEPVPKENEWGWAKFFCVCGKEFHGFGEMSVSTSDCYQCGMAVPVEKVLPPRRRIGQRKKSRTPHSCNGFNCHNPSYGLNQMIHMGSKGSTHYSHNGRFTNNFYSNTMQGPAGVAVPVPGAVYRGDMRAATVGSAGNATDKTRPGAPGSYPNKVDQAVCCHPKSVNANGHKRIRTPSKKHTSSGSSVTTFLSQGSLDTSSQAVDRIPATIPE